MSEVTRDDRIRNKYVRGSIGVASIVNEMRENRREKTKAVRVVMKMNAEGGKKGSGRPKIKMVQYN